MNQLTGYAIVFFFVQPGRITRAYFGHPVGGLHTLADVKRRLVEVYPGGVFLSAEFQETDSQMNPKRRFQWWPAGLMEIKSDVSVPV